MLLNAILFVLIGLEMLELHFERRFVTAALLAIPIVLVSRYVSLLAPVAFFRKRLNFVPHTTTIMTWGGLRGGISIALALSLHPKPGAHPQLLTIEQFHVLLTATYAVVVFSIVVQGLSVGPLAKKLIGEEGLATETASSH